MVEKEKILNGSDSSPNYKTDKNHYLIALRTTSKELWDKKREYDFHFMRRTADGCWRFKAGQNGPVMQINNFGRFKYWGYNPSNISWDLYNHNTSFVGLQIYNVAKKNYYTSNIVYIKVSY